MLSAVVLLVVDRVLNGGRDNFWAMASLFLMLLLTTACAAFLVTLRTLRVGLRSSARVKVTRTGWGSCPWAASPSTR
ncbi:hypothetical protein WMF28_37135 [Sorangium sp. So ce590]|uniref:hypothetical protein n=1 Tax=Sorangium sp. So ce590 TaxID=3133317 RepID=UPI003F60C936